MQIKKTKLLSKENLNEVIGYKEVKVYENLVDFKAAFLNKNFKYEIFGLKEQVKVGDFIYLDIAIFEDCHTYIFGRVIKVLKTKIVIDYVYTDLI